MNKNRELVLMALLISLTVVLTRMASIKVALFGVESIRIGFGAFPVILAGLMLGWRQGGIVGAVADVVGYFINPTGPFMPHFTFAAALIGLLPALGYQILPQRLQGVIGYFLVILVTQAAVSGLLVPYFLQDLFGVPMKATVPPRMIMVALTSAGYALIYPVLLSKLRLSIGIAR